MYGDRIDDLPARTLALARKGGHAVAPNPKVGAVIAKNGRIISEGFHSCYGGLHAETEALVLAGTGAEGAALYCNLEPCSFDKPGKHQPPCTRGIIEAGIRRVIIGQLDPNPHVRGSGVRQLQDAGIEVIVEDDPACWYENDRFNTRMALDRPFVHIKCAMSADGRIAAAGGSSKWISDEAARKEVHDLRRGADGVAVGIGTVLADDPMLTVRNGSGRLPAKAEKQPRPVVFDSALRIPFESRLVRDRASELIVVYGIHDLTKAPGQKKEALLRKGVTLIGLPDGYSGGTGEEIDSVLRSLRNIGMDSILVEGGSRLVTAFIRSGCYDRLTLYIAPILIGSGVPVAGDLGVLKIDEAVRFENIRWRALGNQQVFDGMRDGWLRQVREVVRSAGIPIAEKIKEDSYVYGTH